MTNFPPTGPVTVTKTIPAYLYQEYYDDEDLQAFVAAYNNLSQQMLDWFNTIGLPVYIGLSGALLDWVAEGLYGLTRPVLGSGQNQNLGALNTYVLDPLVLPLNTIKKVGPSNFAVVNDDVFKRILTWWLYRGDGKQFDIRWLKRRVMRFLIGTNGVDPPVDQTYQVSVTFAHGIITITIYNGIRRVVGGAIPNQCLLNSKYPNELDTTFTVLAPLTFAPILQEAVNAGVLALPFQYTFVVNIVG